MTNSKIMNNNSREQDTHKLVLKLNFVGNIAYQADKCALHVYITNVTATD